MRLDFCFKICDIYKHTCWPSKQFHCENAKFVGNYLAETIWSIAVTQGMRNACMEHCAISRIFWNKITKSLFCKFCSNNGTSRG